MVAKLLNLAIIGMVISPNVAEAFQEPPPLQKETKICRESDTKTGSRIRTGRRCRTAEEWRKEDEERSRLPVTLTVTEGQNDGRPPQRPQ